MRGLPSCGKTTTARAIVAEEGGVLVEFDEFFYTEVGTDPARYDWSDRLLEKARAWNIERLFRALETDVSPIVLDDDNGYGITTRTCVTRAVELGYAVEFREPDSPWWGEIRSLLADKDANESALVEWAHKLTVLSRGTHRVPFATFLRRMERWQDEIRVEDILGAPEGEQKRRAWRRRAPRFRSLPTAG